MLISGLILTVALEVGEPLRAETNSTTQVLALMDQRRERVISSLSFGEKMKLRSAMGCIRDNPEFVAANNAVTHAPTPEARVKARKALAKLKLELLEKQDPSLRPILEKIHEAEASAPR